MTASSTAAPVALGRLAITPRSLADYRDMFLLTDADLAGGPILDCPAGASPFAAEVRAKGGRVVSTDPAFRLPATQLVAQATDALDRIEAWQLANPAIFNWSYLGSPEALNIRWREAVDVFAADFALDRVRYVDAALPELPFADEQFNLTVSGFLLFVYPELLDFDMHLQALLELVRVTAGEVRVYPLHDTVGSLYRPLPELCSRLADAGVRTEFIATGSSYTHEPGGDRMLVCTRRRQS